MGQAEEEKSAYEEASELTIYFVAIMVFLFFAERENQLYESIMYMTQIQFGEMWYTDTQYVDGLLDITETSKPRQNFRLTNNYTNVGKKQH